MAKLSCPINVRFFQAKIGNQGKISIFFSVTFFLKLLLDCLQIYASYDF